MSKITQGDVFQYGEQTFITIAVESNKLRALPLDAGVRIVHVGNHALPLRDFSRKLELPLMELPVIERRGFDGARVEPLIHSFARKKYPAVDRFQ